MTSATADRQQSRSSGGATASQGAQIATALVRLSQRTTRRSEDEGDHLARQEIYLQDLLKYPEHVALKALDAAGEESRFFPTWNELLILLNRYNDAPAAPTPQLAAPDARPDGQRALTSESLSERMARLDPARGVQRLAAIGAPQYRDLMAKHRRLSDQGVMSEIRALDGGVAVVDIGHAEKLVVSVMRSELGQRALSEQWGRFLWDFVVEHGRSPREREIDALIREAKEFDLALADCDKATASGKAWAGGALTPKALASLGRTLLEREDRLAAEYWVAAAA